MHEFRGYPVRLREIDVGGRVYRIAGPANYESLVDDPRVVARFERDEYMPYWAEFWPASRLLAEEIAGWPAASAEDPPLLLELGCGLGLVGLVAISRGYRAVLSDYDDDALAFVRESAALNGLPPPETRFIDWRESYDELRPARIVAAEILYERRHLAPVAEFIRRHLAPGGAALICDNWRSVADGFAEAAQRAGLRVETRRVERTLQPGNRLARARFFALRAAE